MELRKLALVYALLVKVIHRFKTVLLGAGTIVLGYKWFALRG